MAAAPQPLAGAPPGKARGQESSTTASQPAQAPQIITEPAGSSQAPQSGSATGQPTAGGQSNGRAVGNQGNGAGNGQGDSGHGHG